jgi:uncharacterized membrane protein
VTGLVVCLGIDVNLFANLTGTAETLSVIPVFVLLALALTGLVVVIVDTSRIHGADAAVRVSAKDSVSHYPLYAHAYRSPPRHHGSWVFVIFMLVAMTGLGSGRTLTDGDGSAIPTIIAGLLVGGVALLLLYVLFVIVRSTSTRRSQPMSAPARADPGAVRRPRHPDRGHHGSGVHRPARRGRGRR